MLRCYIKSLEDDQQTCVTDTDTSSLTNPGQSRAYYFYPQMVHGSTINKSLTFVQLVLKLKFYFFFADKSIGRKLQIEYRYNSNLRK